LFYLHKSFAIVENISELVFEGDISREERSSEDRLDSSIRDNLSYNFFIIILVEFFKKILNQLFYVLLCHWILDIPFSIEHALILEVEQQSVHLLLNIGAEKMLG
jgi:hypothetical protein